MTRITPWALVFAAACTSEVTVIERALQDAGDAPHDDAGDALADAEPVDGPGDAAVPFVPEGRRVAAFEHSCAARSDGVYCWGVNESGQLGLGDLVGRMRPERVPGLSEVRALCAGEEHSCAVDARGSLACWGNNDRGQLGSGDHEAALAPRPVPGSYLAVACGGYVTCAIDARHALLCWGENWEGQIARESQADVLAPSPVAEQLAVSAVAVGQGHVCAIDVVGALWCWGRNTEQQLGLADPRVQLRTPTRVGSDTDFRAIAAAQTHSCALRRNTSLWCWGAGAQGQLGMGTTATAESPAPVGGTRSFYAVAASWFHTCAVHGAGTLACFGRNQEGQLGLGDTSARTTPGELQGSWDDVATGRFHSCARRGDDVWCWGKNDRAQLGLGDLTRRTSPAQLTF